MDLRRLQPRSERIPASDVRAFEPEILGAELAELASRLLPGDHAVPDSVLDIGEALFQEAIDEQELAVRVCHPLLGERQLHLSDVEQPLPQLGDVTQPFEGLAASGSPRSTASKKAARDRLS